MDDDFGLTIPELDTTITGQSLSAGTESSDSGFFSGLGSGFSSLTSSLGGLISPIASAGGTYLTAQQNAKAQVNTAKVSAAAAVANNSNTMKYLLYGGVAIAIIAIGFVMIKRR